MAVTPVSHPGPRPTEFAYPFEEARAAIVAIDELVDELALCAADHEAATAEASVGFEGASRRAFERRMGDALSTMAAHRRQLDGDAQELRAQLAIAHQRRRDREDAMRRWDGHMASYRDYQGERADFERSGLR